MSEARKNLVRLLVYLAEKAAGVKEKVEGDLAYGLRMAELSIANPPRCVCLPCIMGRGTCTYEEREPSDEGVRDGQRVEDMFDMRSETVGDKEGG